MTPRTLRTSPYFLIYGKETILPPNIYLPSLQLTQYPCGRSSNFRQNQINALLKLKEERDIPKDKFHVHQQRIKIWLDKHVFCIKQFQIGGLILKWDNVSEVGGKHSKFQKLWLGPYEIV